MDVHKNNGYLPLDHMKLEEFQPGLLFISHGEGLDLRGAPPTWRNIALEKMAIPAVLWASLVVCALIFLWAILV